MADAEAEPQPEATPPAEGEQPAEPATEEGGAEKPAEENANEGAGGDNDAKDGGQAEEKKD